MIETTPKSTKTPRNYVNNKQLFDEMVAYKYAVKKYNENPDGKLKPQIPEYVGMAIMTIANKVASNINFSSYSYREEMIGDGIENAIRYLDNFDPEKTNNPFAYFTQIIAFCFIRRIQKEKRQQYIKYKNLDNMYNGQELVEHGAISRNSDFLENSHEFVRAYEKAIEDKKAEKKLPRDPNKKWSWRGQRKKKEIKK